MSGPTPAVREQVRERDLYTCQLRGCYIGPLNPDYSLQHRRCRGMGGSKRPDTNLPANLVLVCGSATTKCHGWIEANPIEAERLGFRVRQGANPASVPITTYRGVRLLNNEGSWEEVAC